MKAAIFDIDGTLVDSVDLHAQAWQDALRDFGHKVGFGEIRAQIGKGGDQLLPVFLSREEIAAKGEEIEKYRGKLFKENFLQEVKAFPQVRALFERLRADGWKLALASSAKEEELKIYKEICQVGDLLDAETSSDDAEKSKPHPDIFLAAMQRLGGVHAADCVVVGDSPYDGQAARKAGIRAVAFRCGGFPEGVLRDAGFEALYQGAADLLRHYEHTLFYQERPSKQVS